MKNHLIDPRKEIVSSSTLLPSLRRETRVMNTYESGRADIWFAQILFFSVSHKALFVPHGFLSLFQCLERNRQHQQRRPLSLFLTSFVSFFSYARQLSSTSSKTFFSIFRALSSLLEEMTYGWMHVVVEIHPRTFLPFFRTVPVLMSRYYCPENRSWNRPLEWPWSDVVGRWLHLFVGDVKLNLAARRSCCSLVAAEQHAMQYPVDPMTCREVRLQQPASLDWKRLSFSRRIHPERQGHIQRPESRQKNQRSVPSEHQLDPSRRNRAAVVATFSCSKSSLPAGHVDHGWFSALPVEDRYHISNPWKRRECLADEIDENAINSHPYPTKDCIHWSRRKNQVYLSWWEI